jgi:hypothetical protein
LIGLERSLKIPKDVIDVMAQTKWPAEDTTHLNASIKSDAPPSSLLDPKRDPTMLKMRK